MDNQQKATGRLLLRIFCVLLLIAPATGLAQSQPAFQKIIDEDYQPPNIVLVLLDWGRRDAIGVYSEKDVSTPNIDRLANEGVRFENAYTPATLCSPARASIITGTYPHAHGVRKTMYPPGINGGLPTMYLEPIANPFDEPEIQTCDKFSEVHYEFRFCHCAHW